MKNTTRKRLPHAHHNGRLSDAHHIDRTCGTCSNHFNAPSHRNNLKHHAVPSLPGNHETMKSQQKIMAVIQNEIIVEGHYDIQCTIILRPNIHST